MKSWAEAARKAAQLKTYGIDFNGEIQPNFSAIMARKDKVVSTLVGGIDKAFKTGEVRLIKGTGEVVDPHLVRVVDRAGESHEVVGDKLILATGSRPQGLPNLSFDGKHILSSDDVLKLETMPRKIIILDVLDLAVVTMTPKTNIIYFWRHQDTLNNSRNPKSCSKILLLGICESQNLKA